MQKSIALQVFEALSSGVRLDVFRLLVRAGRAGKVAGEIAEVLDIAPSNLSFHLKGLTQCGLLTAEQEGRYQRYRANLPLMLETIAFLTENCCGDHPDECADLRRGVPAAAPFLPALERSREDPCGS